MPTTIETIDILPNASTTAVLDIGTTARGTIGIAGDHDFYRVNLVAGQTYSFAMVGTGSASLSDTYLRLYAANGTTQITFDDDTPQNRNSIISFTPTASGTYYLDASAYSATATGQYGISASLGRANFDADMITGILNTHTSWSSAPGTGTVVTYGFRDTYSGTETNFSHVGAAQQAAIAQILQFYSEITGLTFQQVNPGGYTDNATILFSDYSANDGAGAYASYPGSTAATSAAGDVWMNTSVSTTSLPFGGYSYFAIMHELGHALGLSHPGAYNAGVGVSITYANNAQFIQDSNQYSIMSYFGASNTGGTQGGYSDTPMLFDIAALQLKYGANMTTRATDTVYGFGSTAGDVYDFTKNTTPALTIWDGGGTDTLNASGFSQAQTIDLVAGNFSSIGGLVSNVSIAFGATIENAFGGSGADTITGNAVANTISGGAGNDTIDGGAGNDVLIGGVGNDTLYGGVGNDTLNGGDGNDLLDGSIGDDVFQGSTGSDTFVGDTGSDVCDYSSLIGSGVFTLTGTSGSVVKSSGGTDTFSGIDYLIATMGSDTLYVSGSNCLINLCDGADTLWATGANNLQVVGGAGDKVIVVGGEAGSVTGITAGSGNSIVNGSTSQGILYIAPGTGTGVNVVVGGQYSNHIYGNENQGTLYMRGGVGQDELVGGLNHNFFICSGGGDFATTGGTSNVFQFNDASANLQHIYNFNANTDVFSFYASGFGGGLTASQALTEGFNFINGTTSVAATGTFLYSVGALYWDLDGIGNAAPVLMVGLGGTGVPTALSTNNFRISGAAF